MFDHKPRYYNEPTPTKVPKAKPAGLGIPVEHERVLNKKKDSKSEYNLKTSVTGSTIVSRRKLMQVDSPGQASSAMMEGGHDGGVDHRKHDIDGYLEPEIGHDKVPPSHETNSHLSAEHHIDTHKDEADKSGDPHAEPQGANKGDGAGGTLSEGHVSYANQEASDHEALPDFVEHQHDLPEDLLNGSGEGEEMGGTDDFK